jgi:hypothetical protein
VHGVFANLRVAMVALTLGIYYFLPWFNWGEGRQAFLIDLPNRKFHLFAWTFWPQDLFYLTAIPGDLGTVAVPVHRDSWTSLVWFHLSADGVDRGVPVDRAQDRGRPPEADEAGAPAVEPARQVRQEGQQAFRLDPVLAVDRLHLRRLCNADTRAVDCR